MNFILKLGLGSAILLQLVFRGESDPNFSWDEFPLGQQSVQKKKKKKNALVPWTLVI